MSHRIQRLTAFATAACLGAGALPAPASATSYMFWMPPSFAGEPVTGDEPGLAQPLPGAKPEELRANMLWAMRAGLNVAALQCQFAPALATVRNYNAVLAQHGAELNKAYATISTYFKRTGGKTWQTTLDQYTTRTYNGFSTMHAQLGFCDAAGQIGRDALARPRGSLYLTAQTRMREFRNSLVPQSDGIYALRYWPQVPSVPTINPDCWDKKNQLRKKCAQLPS